MSAGERLPGTPVPGHIWDGYEGIKIAGDTWGNPNNQLVILQHGGGQTRHAWKGAGETLGLAGYHAVAFDARGHGDSEWPGKATTVPIKWLRILSEFLVLWVQKSPFLLAPPWEVEQV